MSFGESECLNCRTMYPLDYWDEIINELEETIKLEDNNRVIDTFNDTILDWEATTICCGQEEDDCSCANQIPGEMCYELGMEVYEDDDECRNCAWVASPACPGLRIATREYVQGGKQLDFDRPKIQPCSAFTLDPLTVEEANAA